MKTLQFITIYINVFTNITMNKNALYVLELLSGKYYVGKSTNVNARIRQHFINKGPTWTNVYKPVNVLEIINSFDKFDEDKKVKEYMDKFGIHNVRGGSYSRFVLNQDEIKFLTKELLTSNDRCFKCGDITHFANKCTSK